MGYVVLIVLTCGSLLLFFALAAYGIVCLIEREVWRHWR